jgi:hypothetical protein
MSQEVNRTPEQLEAHEAAMTWVYKFNELINRRRKLINADVYIGTMAEKLDYKIESTRSEMNRAIDRYNELMKG